MADKTTKTSELKLEAEFYDKDTRTITLPDPKKDLTDAQIKAFGNVIKSTEAIIGDKTGAKYVRLKNAQRVDKESIKLDLKS